MYVCQSICAGSSCVTARRDPLLQVAPLTNPIPSQPSCQDGIRRAAEPSLGLSTLLSSSMNNLSFLQLRMILPTLFSYLHSQDLKHNSVSFDYSQLPNQPWHYKSYFPFLPKENEQPASPCIIGQTSETTALPDFQIIVLLLSDSPLLQTVAELCSPEDTNT